jgi:hypothetical protein
MAKLTAADFFKEATASRPDRKRIFLDKYKKQEAFELASGVNMVFKYEPKVYEQVAGLIPGDNKGYGAVVLKGSNNRPYKMTDLAKNKEFGGGGGSGAGAENTKMNESSVCMWCAVYKETGKADLATVVKNYSKVKSDYITDETDKNMISQTDKAWLDHYERTAEFLVDGLFKQGEWVFHRGSDLVDAINTKFKEVNKKMDVPFANINKWSPADIWVSKKGFKLDLSKVMFMDDLNRYLTNELKNRNLIGISLKKTANSIHQTNYNVGEKRAPMYFDGFRVMSAKKDANIFSSKDTYIVGKGEDSIDMQLRSFDDLSGWQGELIGAVAKYGKIAYGPINLILADLGLDKLPEQQTIVAKARAKDAMLAKKIYTLFSKYAEPGMTEAQYMTIINSKDTKSDWLYSKYFGVQLIDTLMTTTQAKRDEFVQGALGYALSNTKHSAPFIKVS